VGLLSHALARNSLAEYLCSSGSLTCFCGKAAVTTAYPTFTKAVRLRPNADLFLVEDIKDDCVFLTGRLAQHR
jgi:hypothetical protein